MTPAPAPSRALRAAGFAGDVAMVMGVVLCVPLAVIVVGLPFAGFVRLVLWALA